MFMSTYRFCFGAAAFCTTNLNNFRRQPQNKDEAKYDDNFKHADDPKQEDLY